MSPNDRVQDRRVEKTQGLLRQALVSLIGEKPYDAISVKEILDRANVGKSTFYLHFRDKDELLVSGIHQMLRSVQTARPTSAKQHEKIIRFSLPIFEYHHQHRRVGEARVGLRAQAIVHDRLKSVLAEMMAQELGEDFQVRKRGSAQISPDLLAQYVASTFVLVLDWWVESENPLPPVEVNDLFRALVLPTLAAAGG